MKRIVTRSLSLCLVFLFLVAATSCGPQSVATPTSPAPAQSASTAGSGNASSGSVYKIGFIASVTGSGSSLGEPERDVALMLQKQFDEAGGIQGPDGILHPVQILIHDTEGNSDNAVQIVKKLINDEGVIAIIGPSTSPEAMALIPVMQEAGVTLLSMASSSAIVKPVAERKWIFKVAQSNEHTAPWQVKYAKAKGLTKVANVYVNNAYGEDGAAAIRETAKAEGVEIVLEETFDAADTDMTAQITKIKSSGAQAVLVTAIPPAAAIFTKQYRELGVTLPLLHNSGVGVKSFIDLSGTSNAEGVLFPMGKLVAADQLKDDDPQKAVLQKFIADYKAFSNGKSPSQFGAHAWDCIMIIANVLKTFPEGLSLQDQRSKLRDGIEQTKNFVGTDGIFNFSPEDHVGLSANDVVMVQVKDGGWVYLPPEQW